MARPSRIAGKTHDEPHPPDVLSERPVVTYLHSLMPWATRGVRLENASVLELGSGPRLNTEWLCEHAGFLHAVERD